MPPRQVGASLRPKVSPHLPDIAGVGLYRHRSLFIGRQQALVNTHVSARIFLRSERNLPRKASGHFEPKDRGFQRLLHGETCVACGKKTQRAASMGVDGGRVRLGRREAGEEWACRVGVDI